MLKNLTKKKISKLKPSATLEINEISKKLIYEGKKIYRFGFGQSPFPVPEKIVAALRENAKKKDYLPHWKKEFLLISIVQKMVVKV